MNTSKLRNGRYFLGRFDKPNDCGGWFIGSFFKDGHPCKTDNIEVLYRVHKKGDVCKSHYHKKKVELLIMIEGKARYTINDKAIILESGNFLFVDVNNVIAGEFLKPSKIFAIHSPSIVTDKVEL